MAAVTHTPLTRQRILTAAVRFVDEYGLETLSMRKLAASLGYEAMSLYNHVPNKSALLTGMLELLLAEVQTPLDDGMPWIERLRRGAQSFRRVAHEHPAFVRLLISQREYTERLLRPTELGLQILRGAGLDAAQASFAYRTLMGFLLGALLQEEAGVLGVSCGDLGTATAASAVGTSAGSAVGNGDRPGHTAAAVGLPVDRFPFLLDALQTPASTDDDAAFDFGLDLILAGLQGLRPSTPRR